jgi:hypothetical protein
MKHTQGPWKYVPSTKSGTVMARVECGDNSVFTVSSHRADGQADANARLMAAAPEMLTVLEYFDRLGPSASQHIELTKMVSLVLKMVRGES